MPAVSATEIAAQAPGTWKNRGRRRMLPTKNKKVLAKDKRAEIFPLLRAVNQAEAKILTGISKKDKENRGKPFSAMSYTRLWAGVNTDRTRRMAAKERMYIKRVQLPMITRLF